MEPTGLDYVKILLEKFEAGIRGAFDTLILPVAGAIIVLVIIYGGIQYITGGPKGAETGKKTIIAALIGAIIIALSVMIINMIGFFIH